jgi:hypothetical protein
VRHAKEFNDRLTWCRVPEIPLGSQPAKRATDCGPRREPWDESSCPLPLSPSPRRAGEGEWKGVGAYLPQGLRPRTAGQRETLGYHLAPLTGLYRARKHRDDFLSEFLGRDARSCLLPPNSLRFIKIVAKKM